MTSPLKTQCPNCSKTLKLKSKAALGKRVPCPKCKKPFEVQPYEEPPQEEEWEDDYSSSGDSFDYDDDYGDDHGDDGYEDEYEEQPARRSNSKKSSKKKKKKAGGAPGWLKPVGIGAAALVALSLLGGGVVFVVQNLGGGGSNPINLSWLPSNADFYMKADPAAMWNAPILAPLRENQLVKNAMAQAGQNGSLDLKPEDIESVTLAGVNMVDMVQRRIPLFGGAPNGPDQVVKKADGKTIGVIRTRRDITADEISGQPGAAKEQHDGKDIYMLTQPDGKIIGWHLADATTILFGDKSELTAAIDRGPTESRVSRIDFINSDHQLIFVIAPEKVLPVQSASSGTTPGDQLTESFNKNAKHFFFGLSLTSDIEFESRVSCYGSTEATTLKGDLETILADGKSKLDEAGAAAPPGFEEFLSIAKESLDSIKPATSGEQVAFTGRIPGRFGTAVQDAIESNPLISMMMSGLGNAGPPGGMQPPTSPGSFGNPPPTGAGSPGTQPQGSFEDQTMAQLQQEKQQTQGTLDEQRARINQTTGALQGLIPGGSALGGSNAPKLQIECSVTSFRGGDPVVAARTALRGAVPGIDTNSISYDAATKKLRFQVPKAVGTARAQSALQGAGFEISGLLERPAE